MERERRTSITSTNKGLAKFIFKSRSDSGKILFQLITRMEITSIF